MKLVKATATERKIFDAIKEAKARGLKIKDGGWYIKWSEEEARFVPEDNCCCPLGALLLSCNEMPPDVIDLHDGDNNPSLLLRAASECLGKDTDWCERFVETFDDPDNAPSYSFRSAKKAALKIRELEYNEHYGITK